MSAPAAAEDGSLTVPAPARGFLLACVDANWGVLAQWRFDTGGAPYLVVNAADLDGREIRLTWHTRTSGTPRLSAAMTRGDGRRWRDASLRAAMRYVTEHPARIARREEDPEGLR